MPILLEPPGAAEDLAQGDLLEGIQLHEAHYETGPRAIRSTHALVLSRDCVLANKPRVLVAAVRAADLNFGPPDDPEKTFDAFRKHLSTLRDGGSSPDVFYLGSLPGRTDRLFARFDEVVTLTVPLDAGKRREWLGACRKARLAPEFVAAIPVRFFWALGRTGFDDEQWYPDQDLAAMVTAGEAHLAGLQAAVHSAEFEAHTIDRPEAQAGLKKKVDAAKKKLQEFGERLAPFQSEKRRRGESG